MEEEVGVFGPDLEATRAKLRELGRRPSLQARTRSLNALADALGKPEAQAWARVDLGLVFSDDVVRDPAVSEQEALAAGLEKWRNISVLAPLIITWMGIASATHAYGNLLDVQPEQASKPFIQLWEQGFNGTASWWVLPFSVIGALDVIAVGIVIGLSYLVGRARVRAEVDLPAADDLVRDELRDVLVDASLLLAKDAMGSPRFFDDTLTVVAQKMADVESRIVQSGAQADKALERAIEVVEKLDAAALKMTEAGGSIAGGLKAVEPLLSDARDELKAVAAADRAVAAEVGRGIGSLSAAAGDVASSARDVAQAASGVGHDFRAGGAAADRLAQSVETAAEKVGDASGGLDSVTALVKLMEDYNDRLRDILMGAQVSAQTMASAATQADQTSTGLSEALGDDVAGLPSKLRELIDLQRTYLVEQGELFGRYADQVIREARAQTPLPRRRWWRRSS